MAELARGDAGDLEEALQIRQAEKILQERQRQRQERQRHEQAETLTRHKTRKRDGPAFEM